MSSKFFTNESDNSVLKKFEGVFTYMSNLYAFHAVVGYFRSSGYFSIRNHLINLKEVKILVGIDVDHIAAEAQRRGLLFFGDEDKTRDEFIKWMQKDIVEAKYSREVEEGILQFMEDVMDGKIELRAHKSKKLHAKIYIFLPNPFNQHSSGTVITGSSNLTEAGLGKRDHSKNYEFNVELRDYDEVKFAEDEFQKLWKESVTILPANFQAVKDSTHLQKQFTPFELYIKFLIEYFGKNIEYDPEALGDVPIQFRKLSYQVDAVNQGYNMLMDHNGFFLADVVGTGKTVVATMLAKKFIIANGTQNTKILVVYPPAVEKNWKRTFRLFGIDRYAKFITNGSLEKIIDDDINYWAKEEYDLILVDEAHKFRNHRSQAFQFLQIICKAGRQLNGMIPGTQKKVVLISATPLNNRPEDIYYLLQLFQNARRSTLPVSNLQNFFGRIIDEYRLLKKQSEPDMERVRQLYSEIRERVLKPITIRRTRRDLMEIEQYRKDLLTQGIRFPAIAEPIAKTYDLDDKLNELFFRTIFYLTDEHHIKYYRYQAIANLRDDIREREYENPEIISIALAFIMKTMLVKRLESSFKAFKISLSKYKKANQNLIDLFDRGNVFIAPDLDINKLLDEGFTDEEIEAKILEISENNPENKVFKPEDFKEDFYPGLVNDQKLLNELCDDWEKIDYDPKIDVFIDLLKNELFSPKINPTGKLVIFTESKDTGDYLFSQLTNKKNGFTKILNISAENRQRMFDTILENFDANYDKERKNDYDIIISTEVLSEGINLHRSSVVVNYDTPWNATRLMQRVGRVNRIGSIADCIYNYNFRPSTQGDQQIKLYKTSLMKLQGFHTAFGEDAKIYTLDEVIEQFKLFKDGLPEEKDIRLQYLQFIRDYKEKNAKEFKRIKNLPLKARAGRATKKVDDKMIENNTIGFLKSEWKKEIYFIDKKEKVFPLTFEEAAPIFEALENESPLPIPDFHYQHVTACLNRFVEESSMENDGFTVSEPADARTNFVKKFLRDLRPLSEVDGFEDASDALTELLDEGTYVNLTIELDRLRKNKKLKQQAKEKTVIQLAGKYVSRNKPEEEKKNDKPVADLTPEIIISETFYQP